MKRVKNAIAILVALVMLLSLAACKEAPECKIALEANGVTELTAGTTLEDDVAAAIADMIQNGGLNEEANTVLISLDSQDAAMQKKVLDMVCAAFEDNGFTGAALCQYAADPAQGKAQLVKTLCDANEIFVEEELQALSVNALKLVCETTTISGIQSAGSASQVALVGADTAVEVALYYAETSADAVADLSTKLDYSAGLLFYDVQFTLNGEAQEAYVDAVSGEVLYSGVVGGESNMDTEDDPVTEQDAIAAACASVGAQVADIKDVTCEFVEYANPPYFDVTFTYEGKEQHVMIVASTGLVLETDLPADETVGDNTDVETVTPEDPSVPVATEGDSSSGGMTETEAEEIPATEDIPATEEVPATEETTEEIEPDEEVIDG